MKKHVYLLITIGLLSANVVMGQKPEAPKDSRSDSPELKMDLKAIKTGIITQALSLTSEQAEQFWPIYRQYNEQIMALKRDQVNSLSDVQPGDVDQWNDQKVAATLKQLRQNKLKEQELVAQMEKELKSVISDKQILQLHLSEERFRRRLINRMKSRRNRMRNQ
ncbi:MAG: hypothetical protein ACPGZQ_02295 [Flavobacteriaceae bacterium]